MEKQHFLLLNAFSLPSIVSSPDNTAMMITNYIRDNDNFWLHSHCAFNFSSVFLLLCGCQAHCKMKLTSTLSYISTSTDPPLSSHPSSIPCPSPSPLCQSHQDYFAQKCQGREEVTHHSLVCCLCDFQ